MLKQNIICKNIILNNNKIFANEYEGCYQGHEANFIFIFLNENKYSLFIFDSVFLLIISILYLFYFWSKYLFLFFVELTINMDCIFSLMFTLT